MTKFRIEYELKNASTSILWNSIGTPLGLSEWFANGVTVNENEYIFSWDDTYQSAKLVEIKPYSHIRFQWLEDEGTDSYFEIKIVSLELSGNAALVVTDYAEPDDVDDLILLWNKEIELLRRKNGV